MCNQLILKGLVAFYSVFLLYLMLDPNPRGSDLIGWGGVVAYKFFKVPQVILMCGQS